MYFLYKQTYIIMSLLWKYQSSEILLLLLKIIKIIYSLTINACSLVFILYVIQKISFYRIIKNLLMEAFIMLLHVCQPYIFKDSVAKVLLNFLYLCISKFDLPLSFKKNIFCEIFDTIQFNSTNCYCKILRLAIYFKIIFGQIRWKSLYNINHACVLNLFGK